MPTVGWIQETAIDRYWERGGLGDLYPPTPKIHYCPYCTRQFESTGDLATHISVDHPIERPLLFIRNKVAYSEQTIRSPISKDDIALTHVNKISVSKDGGELKEWSPGKLKNNLSSNNDGHYSITLLNSDPDNERRVEAHYVIRIKIAELSELDAVDEQFIRTLAIDDVRMSDVRRFSDTCAKFHGAEEYASVLAVYVMGVLIKDQNENTGVSRPWSEFKNKMQQAFETLCDFDRPVARAVCASIKLNLNDFKNPPVQSGAMLLDMANEFFTRVAGGIGKSFPATDYMNPGKRELPACPIDRDSYDLLLFLRKIEGGNVDRSMIEELSVSTSSKTLSDYDLSKLRVLTALAAIQTENHPIARTMLEALVNDPVFGNWAELQLEGNGVNNES